MKMCLGPEAQPDHHVPMTSKLLDFCPFRLQNIFWKSWIIQMFISSYQALWSFLGDGGQQWFLCWNSSMETSYAHPVLVLNNEERPWLMTLTNASDASGPTVLHILGPVTHTSTDQVWSTSFCWHTEEVMQSFESETRLKLEGHWTLRTRVEKHFFR